MNCLEWLLYHQDAASKIRNSLHVHEMHPSSDSSSVAIGRTPTTQKLKSTLCIMSMEDIRSHKPSTTATTSGLRIDPIAPIFASHHQKKPCHPMKQVFSMHPLVLLMDRQQAAVVVPLVKPYDNGSTIGCIEEVKEKNAINE